MTQEVNKLVIPSIEQNTNKDIDVVLMSKRIVGLQRVLIDMSFSHTIDRPKNFKNMMEALHICQEIKQDLKLL